MLLGPVAGLLACWMDVLLEVGIVPIPESSSTMKEVAFPKRELDFLCLSFILPFPGTEERAELGTALGLGASLVLCWSSWWIEVLRDCCLSTVATGQGLFAL